MLFRSVHSHGATGTFNLIGTLLANWLGIPVIAKIATAGDVAGLRARRFGWLRFGMLKRSSAFVCLSAEIRVELLQAGVPERVLHQLPNAVDSLRFRPRNHSSNATILFTGRLVARKGLNVLLSAWPLVLARHPQAQLVIACTGGVEADSVEKELDRKSTRLNSSHSSVSRMPSSA